ncbi:TolC family protein [Allorhodopirellula heiligendammensis]|uniref:Outer membrane efflux protein n=1 Tax=Allorhodopirellula heiligendammensis TaxID=2714739 RepID=A0A5C6BFK8_9BACT|nr:TolC family protein [Allorhodopirellula heiligendammensis]TWU10838.1 Outer membrane efflux protein [Allorhodopirellula heiligendammensis]
MDRHPHKDCLETPSHVPTTKPSKTRTGNVQTQRTRARRRRLAAILCGCVASIATVGCNLAQKIPDGPHDTVMSYHDHSALKIEYPEVQDCATPQTAAAAAATTPNALQDPSQLPAVEITLQDAIRTALANSPVLRSIGGTIITSPAAMRTVYDPSLAHASPQLGVEAALSAFDAQYSQSLFWNKVDAPRNLNPAAIGGGGGGVTNLFPTYTNQTLGTYNNEIRKKTATGATFALRNNVTYTRTDDPSRRSQLFPSAFTGFMEAEYRQPLMRGAGTTYNRIVGTSTIPGTYNGVLIARVNEDVALADFEAAVISMVSDVEQAYWELAASYRVLEATVKGRESALQTYQYQQVRLDVGAGRSDEEAQARSQYYEFEAQVQSALAGDAGLYQVEQRLRYLIGMPASDGTLLKPTTAPLDAKVVFDWQSALGQALVRRVEVRRQKYNVKRRELELVAARLNRRPQADFVGTYRWVGLGDHLIGNSSGAPYNQNLFSSVTSGQYQQWGAGVEFSAPIGLRAASNAVAHANLNLQRERSLLNETELRISHDLSASARSIDLTYQLVETNYNRYLADLRQVDVLRRRYIDGTDNINFLLQAQRRVVVSEAEFYRSISNYNLAIRDFHMQKGSLLAYAEIGLAEGPWCPGAERDAYELGRFLEPSHHPEDICVPRPISSGPFDPSETQPGVGGGYTTDQMIDVGISSPGDAEFVSPLPLSDGNGLAE